MPSNTHAGSSARALFGVALVAGVAFSACWVQGAVAAEQQAAAPVVFTDVTAAAGIDFVETIGDDAMTNIVESAGVGCGFLDYDGDGWMDVYLVNGCWRDGVSSPEITGAARAALAGATDRLYHNRGDGTFEDVTVQAGVAKPGYGMGVVVADYDGDGDSDLYVTNYGPNALYRNNGDGTFTDVAEAAGVNDAGFSVGAVFFDFNGDHRLDLYVGNYVAYDPTYQYYYAPDGFPGPLSYTGRQDHLFRANPDGTFADVTTESGIPAAPLGRAMGVGAFDYDNDGRVDVFVSNDAMENFLLQNTGQGGFTNRALEMGVAYGEMGEATAAMAVEVGDYDNDGFFDVFVPDMRYSCLYRNTGGNAFTDRSVAAGVAEASGQYVSWGAVFADFDLDGVLDLYVSNGDVHGLEAEEDLVFVGSGDGRFVDVSDTAGAWARHKFVSRGAAGADFDNDGDVDLLIASLQDRPVLLRNDTPRQGRHWLSVRLIGLGENRDAIGAVVTARVGDTTMMRQRASGGSYLSQHDPRLHFGLGPHTRVDRLEIRWPNGARQVLTDIPADQFLTVRQEGAPHS